MTAANTEEETLVVVEGDTKYGHSLAAGRILSVES